MNINEYVRKAAMTVRAGKEVTGEDLRLTAEKLGAVTDNPTDWARAISTLKNKGVLSVTGRYRRAIVPSSRGRKMPIYTRVSTR